VRAQGAYSTEAFRALLSRHMLFRNTSARVLDGLAKFARVRHFEANGEIFAKGDPGNTLCGVLLGRVCIYTLSSNGKEVILRILDPGEIFGAIAVLDGGPRTASARAMKPVDLLQINRNRFIPFLHDHPKLGVSMLQVLCGRIRMNVESFEDAVFLRVRARLAKRLLSLAELHGKPAPRGVRIGFRLSQQDLAQMVGATRERVNRELSLWRRQNLIAIDDGMIVLCRPNRLKAVLEEEAV
jgi:CRP/FNR family cyclic AMP-dependent transcriptional regulator